MIQPKTSEYQRVSRLSTEENKESRWPWPLLYGPTLAPGKAKTGDPRQGISKPLSLYADPISTDPCHK